MTKTPGNSEDVSYTLRALYEGNGYSQYKMSKFEEYDLYAKNKDFLISDSVITFTDGNGKLLALKPDVTLSIVKNTADSTRELQKLYYNENVYRMQKGGHNFKEIMQVGLECIGNVDDYCLYEVLALASRSLEALGLSHVLCVSHLGLLSSLMDNIGVPPTGRDAVLHAAGERNPHELASVLASFDVKDQDAALMKQLLDAKGTPGEVLPGITALLEGRVEGELLSRFARTVGALPGDGTVSVDFSVVGDIRYYNGFVFKGYAEGIPASVLSGGQYDTLMKRMGRSSRAIGFAVYLDLFEQYNRRTSAYDVDDVLLYTPNDDVREIAAAADELRQSGERVLTVPTLPDGISYKKILRLRGGKAETLETDA